MRLATPNRLIQVPCAGAAALLLLVVLGAPASAEAKRKPISGKLSKPGYTVIALASDGKARTARAKPKFRLRPPAKNVTLQLRDAEGVYAGPVVAATRKKGKRAIIGVKAGASLGRTAVKPAKGYAKAPRTPKKSLDANRRARAKKGVPIGAGRFGRVRSRRTRGGVPGDRDLDGIPDVLDVDDDGDLKLDSSDSAGGRLAMAAQSDEQINFFFSRLTHTLDTTANANATGLTAADMDTALSTGGDLLVSVLPTQGVPGDIGPNSPELDCGGSIQQPPRPEGLVYCRPHPSGGIGTIGRYSGAETPFPDCCDPDGDGLGTLTADTGPLGEQQTAMTLHHHATTEQIGTGDLMIQHVTNGDLGVTAYLAQLQYVFASVPALVAYDDGQGNESTLEYPVPGANPGPPGPGTRDNGIPVAAGPNGDVVLTLTFWRPQREAVPEWGETGQWIDIGGLRYEVQMEESGKRCPQGAFSENDLNLELNGSQLADQFPGFSDLADDQPANRANTFTYSLNLTRCLGSNGFSFNSGEDRAFSFLASNPAGIDNAQQSIWFKRE